MAHPTSPSYSAATPRYPRIPLSPAPRERYRPSPDDYIPADIPFGSRPPDRFLSRLEDMFKSGRGSDVTIVCESRRFDVHKAILYPLSEVFASMFDGRFMESGQKEVELPDDDPNALADVLCYMYTFKYEGSAETGNLLINHLRVAALADKYDVKELHDLARDEFGAQAGKEDNAVLFAETIRAVYEELELDRFKKYVLGLILDDGILKKYKKQKDKYKPFWDVVKSVHAFAVDLVCGEPTTSTKRSADEETDERAGKSHRTEFNPMDF